MEMQDKEFDDIFRSKLDGFEIEPSAGVWKGITGELDGKRKNTLLPFLSIAASIVVLIAAGLLFIPKKVKVGNTIPVKNGLTKVNRPKIAIPATNTSGVVVSTPTRAGKINKGLTTVNQLAVLHHPTIVKHHGVLPSAETKNKPGEPVKNDEQPVLAATPQSRQEIIIPVVPGNDVPLNIKQTLDDKPVFITKTVLASAQLPVTDNHKVQPVKLKNRIHSFGDLLNVVIAKIDKRKDKIIEFTNADDDDGSNITGVNLGVIKIKKENK